MNGWHSKLLIAAGLPQPDRRTPTPKERLRELVREGCSPQ